MSGEPFHAFVDSPVGELLLVGDGASLSGIYLEGGRRPPVDGNVAPPATVPFAETKRQLDEYFAGERAEFDLPLAPAGTPFQLLVWGAVRKVGHGETVTYGDLADRIGRPGAARAVGAANGANPISIVIPCHRLVGSTGALTGYSGGLGAKAELLELEARTCLVSRAA